MKCENCGKNEVSFVYRSSINGRTEEHHLCQACAEKLGYTQKLFNRRPSMRDSFFGNDDFFGDFFSPMPSLLGRMNRMLESPFDDFFDAMPAIGAAPVQEVQEEKKDDLMSHEEQSRFSYLRQLNALKLEHEEGYPRGELRAGRPAAGRDPQAGGGPQGGQGVPKGRQGKRLTGAFKQNAHPRIKEVLNYE